MAETQITREDADEKIACILQDLSDLGFVERAAIVEQRDPDGYLQLYGHVQINESQVTPDGRIILDSLCRMLQDGTWAEI